MATASKSPSMKLMKTPGKAAQAAPVEPTEDDPVAEEAPTEEPPVAPKTTSKTVSKPKPKAAPAVAEPEPDANDMITNTVNELENMKSEKAFKLVPQLLDNIDHDYFKLGGVLSVIQTQGWFMDKGHDTFRSFVEAECGIQYRKSMYLIEIYNGLVESGVAWDQVKHLGWTKLKELANILSVDNVEDWVAVAENLTVLQLIEHIKESTKGENAANSPEKESSASNTTTMTFKLHTDQKATVREALDKAKNETGTEFDAVALEHMALDFLGGESKLKTMPTLAALMKGKSAEEVLEAFGTVFPDIELEATIPGDDS